MKEETFNKIDSVYRNLEASKGKISYNTLCKEAQTSMRSVSNYFKVREGRASLSSSTGSGTGTTGTGSAVAPSEFIANLSKLYGDLKKLKDSSDIKYEEVCIIGGLIGCIFEECSNLYDIVERKNKMLELQRELAREVMREIKNTKNEIKQEGKIININR